MHDVRPRKADTRKGRSPMALAMEFANADGFECDVVERWIGGLVKIRKDFFGCIDLMLVDVTGILRGVLGVQVTSMNNVSSRVTKAKTECATRLLIWLRAGNRFQVWGFQEKAVVLVGKNRKTAMIDRRVIEVTEHDLQAAMSNAGTAESASS